MGNKIRREMDMIACKMEVRSELIRMRAIIDAFNNGYYDIVAQGLELSIDNLEDILKLLDKHY